VFNQLAGGAGGGGGGGACAVLVNQCCVCSINAIDTPR